MKYTVAIQTDNYYEAVHDLDATELHEHLRKIGLNYKQTDVWHNDHLLIAIAPQKESNSDNFFSGAFESFPLLTIDSK